MPALYTITTRASGTILTAAIYNADHQNHVNNGDAQHLGGFSANTSQMRTQTSPGDVGTESLAISISDELARIRYMIALQRGTTFWYGTAPTFNVGPGGPNYFRNSDTLVLSRQGQASKAYAASAGDPYTADQWYVHNAANQAFSVSPATPIIPRTLQSILVLRSAAQTGVTQMWVGQPFTLAQIAQFAGQQVTYSFYIFCQANFSAASILTFLCTGTGANAAKISGITGRVDIASVVTTASLGSLVRIIGTGVIPANASQLDFIVAWTPTGTAGANDGFNICGFKLEPGGQATPYYPPDPYVELAELQTWYYKTFQLGVSPAQNTGIPGAFWMSQAGAGPAAVSGFGIRWPTRMLKAPTVTLFNPAAANNQIRNVSTGVDCTVSAVNSPDESGCFLTYSTAVGSAAGNGNAIHMTAEAGI